jgi:hypothetical protein
MAFLRKWDTRTGHSGHSALASPIVAEVIYHAATFFRALRIRGGCGSGEQGVFGVALVALAVPVFLLG